MAFLKELRVHCYRTNCPKYAVVEVMDNRNYSSGLYCRKHGEERLAIVKKEAAC